MDLTQRTRSNLSELEDLSDSDWLDIASSRASEDEDSAAGFDSDREDAEGRPYSRHSFSSLASSSDEVVEGWEGLIEDGADETPLPVADPLADFALTPADRLPRDTASSPVEEEEDPEDERVKAALDQSMMSTLSSSRSNSLSNSLQTSIVHSTRSLRLSFPDPTTSRLESLSASFEELSSSDVGPLPESASPDEDPAADPVRPPTPEVAVSEEPPVEEREIAALALPSKPMFSVFLYGSSLASKMAFVDVLLQKWAIGSGFASRRKLYCESRTVVYAFKGLNNDDSIEHFVSVVDKTGTENSHSNTSANRPSLAILFLPSISEISLPQHTLYLPVMMSTPPSPVDVLGATDYLLEAEQQWESQNIPSSKLTELSRRSSVVVDQEIVEGASHEQIERALRPLSSLTPKKAQPKVSAHAVTIMAILTVVLGYIVNGTLRTPDTRFNASAVATPLLNILKPVPSVVNRSLSTPFLSISSSSSALSLSSFKDIQVAIANPNVTPATADTTTVASSYAAQSTASTSSSMSTVPANGVDGPAECQCGCGLITWPAKTETTDLVLRPTASALSILPHTVNSVSVIPSHTPVVIGKGKGKAADQDSSLYALSTRMATSLSEYFGFSPVMRAAVTDIQDLISAVDQLAHAITRHTSLTWTQSKDAVSVLCVSLKARNERAKVRARQIREAGGAWISTLRQHVRERAEVARENARSLKRRMSDSDIRTSFRARRTERHRLRHLRRLERQERKRAVTL